MRALQYSHPAKLDLKNLPLPHPAPEEVLVKVACAGICGTDIHIMAGEAPAASTVVLGHEFSGIVTSAGKAVSHVKEGQRVAVDPNNCCGRCRYCREGNIHFCEHLEPLGVFRNGAWAEYCLAPARQVYLLPEDIPLGWGSLCEPLSCIVHGWDRLQPLSRQSGFLILGGGIVGILWGLLLRSYNCLRICISEPLEERRRILMDLKFSSLHPAELNHAELSFDVVIDCSGNPPAVEPALERLNPLGKFLQFGVCPMDSSIRFNPFEVFKKELTILGSIINPFTFARTIEIVREIQLPMETLGIKFYPLEEYSRALDDLKSGRVTKGMFLPDRN